MQENWLKTNKTSIWYGCCVSSECDYQWPSSQEKKQPKKPVQTSAFPSLTSELINGETSLTLQHKVQWIRPRANDDYHYVVISQLFFRLTDIFSNMSENSENSHNTLPELKEISSTCLFFLDQQAKSLRLSVCNNITQKNNKSTNLRSWNKQGLCSFTW